MSVCLLSAAACTCNLYHWFIHWGLIIKKEIEYGPYKGDDFVNSRTKKWFVPFLFWNRSDKLNVVSDPPCLLVRCLRHYEIYDRDGCWLTIMYTIILLFINHRLLLYTASRILNFLFLSSFDIESDKLSDWSSWTIRHLCCSDVYDIDWWLNNLFCSPY